MTARRSIAGAALGALPGAAMAAAGLVFVSGEAELSVIVIGITLAVLGALIGVAVSLSGRLDLHRGATGAVVGALPGLVLSRVLPGGVVALAVLAAGALTGWLVGRRAEQRRNPTAG